MDGQDNSNQQRRKFMKICGSIMAAAAVGNMRSAAAESLYRQYENVKLMLYGKPLRASDLPVGKPFIFNYPYITTPCMIMNLGKSAADPVVLTTESGSEYVWTGGAGPNNSIVSYSAICAHRMTYAAKSVSFINYRHSTVVYFDEESRRKEKAQIIYCCSERSIYDPLSGAKVIGGPAPQPLASILLAYDDAADSIHAVGTAGGEMFSKFLRDFEFRLQLDFKITNISQLASGQAEVLPAREYSDTLVYC